MKIYTRRDDDSIEVSELTKAFREHTPIGFSSQVPANNSAQQITNSSNPYSHQLASSQAPKAAGFGQILHTVA